MTVARYKQCKCGRMLSWYPYQTRPANCDRCIEQAEKTKNAVEAVQDRPVIYESMKGLRT